MSKLVEIRRPSENTLKMMLHTTTINPGTNPFLIYSDGSKKELQMNKISFSYLCLVVFKGAMEPISSLELMNFSNNISKFQDLDCKLMGLARDTPMVMQEWLVEPMVETSD